jgi:hypothetical protein
VAQGEDEAAAYAEDEQDGVEAAFRGPVIDSVISCFPWIGHPTPTPRCAIFAPDCPLDGSACSDRFSEGRFSITEFHSFLFDNISVYSTNALEE